NCEIPENNQVPIWVAREGKVPGTHIVKYISDIDQIEILHQAHSRAGFATGAVIAAEFVADKKGILGMNDLLNLG
ncbi:MAG: dihydrodipicolinate reductase C-terminal domain-containing protein, partial [Flectobacillus sp.]|nr:dihydrodipicolinate reductase C-terminal domain-containing protein [Flectobacillus sp.]